MFNFDRFDLRCVRPEEAEEVAAIEKLCFSEAEACTRDRMLARVKKAPELFLVAFDKVNHTIAGSINSLATSETAFRDEFFTDCDLYEKDGKNLMILGLSVRPEYRHQGLASFIMNTYIDWAERDSRDRLILTCHAELVPFYEDLGFTDLGFGNSQWGGVHWHDMVYELHV